MQGGLRATLNDNLKLKLILLVVFVFFITPSAFAEVTDMGFENRHTVRIGIRSDEDDYDFYLTRAQGYVDYSFSQLERTVRFLPFFEYQSNLDTDTWWRKELGAEVGLEFFDGFLYYGASFQHVWQKEENYPVELLEETTEWESRFVFNPKIDWWLFKDHLDLKVFEEYTYDFNRGQGTFNEIGLTIDWKVLENLKVAVGFRHVDRIHDFDSDLLEFSVLFSF